MKILFSSFFSFIIIVLIGSFFIPEAQAASLANIKDIITTSRPSAASPLSANAAAGSGIISIFDNGSRYLASDSAKIIRNQDGAATNIDINVASQSANLQTVYLGSNTSAFAGAGADVLIVPITAKHTVSFTTITSVPVGGHMYIIFPGSNVNSASPSATAFAWNNLQDANVSASFSSGTATCTITATVAGTVDCEVGTASVSPGTTVTIAIGSTTPTLINPTKTATAGTADLWKIFIKTTDGSNDLDIGSTKIGTIESVFVQATVEPTLTFTIAGVANNTNINTIGACAGNITTNSGIPSTATDVNLGILGNGYISRSAQQLTVSTNAATGYVITATSSGQLKNPASGVIILDANGGTSLTANDTPAPETMVAGTPAFGIHPCGGKSNINTNQWVVAGDISTAKFSNPWNTGTNTFYNTIASYSGGAVTSDATAVLYAATISSTTPAGIYYTTLTYVATATF